MHWSLPWQVFNSFATAGYRLHSTIQGSLQLRDNLDQITGEIPLSTTFGNPTILTKPYVLVSCFLIDVRN